jgi:catechol 2,3-dioxygenase-like lactoylglutathione lyase family enzyme
VLDHIGLNVSDYEASKAFYLRALEPLGIVAVMEFPEWKALGLGDGQKPYLWISERGAPCTSTHVALAVPDTETVDAFYTAAIAAGGIDNGAPGLRPHYHEHYYGAFVLDPDGNNLEAVCHRAAAASST